MSSWWVLRKWSNQAAIWNITFCHVNFIPTVLFAYNSLYFLSWTTVLWCWTPLCSCWISECTHLWWCFLTDRLFCKMFWDHTLIYLQHLRSQSTLWELKIENAGFSSLVTGQGYQHIINDVGGLWFLTLNFSPETFEESVKERLLSPLWVLSWTPHGGNTPKLSFSL